MSKSEFGWATLFAVVIGAYVWFMLAPSHHLIRTQPATLESADEDPPVPKEPNPAVQPAPDPPKLPPPLPQPPAPKKELAPAHAVAAKPAKPPKPEETKRDDFPKPKSVRDLLENITRYRLPHKKGGNVDTTIWAYYAGYIYYADNSVKKVRLQRKWGNVRLAIEENVGNVKDWTEHDGQLNLNNYHGDPYGLTIETLDHRLFYLKFEPETHLKNYSRPLKTMVGWLLSDMTPTASVARVALIDIEEHNREFPPGAKDASEWPKTELLKTLTGDLPSENPK